MSWIAEPGNSVLAAVEHGNILAVGAVTGAGDITLNYVSPDAKFCGAAVACSLRSERHTVFAQGRLRDLR